MIRKIKWNDHAILGNLELDFAKPDGSVYNTIVLAGENGTGKTTILERLMSKGTQCDLWGNRTVRGNKEARRELPFSPCLFMLWGS